MKNSNFIIVAIILVIVAGFVGWLWRGPMQSTSSVQNQAASSGQSQKEAEFVAAMNKLWEDHIVWTRSYIVSAVNNLPDKDQVLARLMKNQEDLGDAAKPYYGNAAGDQLTTLLKAHISGAGDVVKAAMDKNVDALAQANTAWHDNANQIADFLATANPRWSQDDLRAMMSDHLNLTTQEASDIINKKADPSIADYDKIHDQILHMSNMLSSGIIEQFPDKF